MLHTATKHIHIRYQQHKGRVFDVLYSHAALRLFSAADDGTLTAYDVRTFYS